MLPYQLSLKIHAMKFMAPSIKLKVIVLNHDSKKRI